jgi:hypothetical protein
MNQHFKYLATQVLRHRSIRLEWQVRRPETQFGIELVNADLKRKYRFDTPSISSDISQPIDIKLDVGDIV